MPKASPDLPPKIGPLATAEWDAKCERWKVSLTAEGRAMLAGWIRDWPLPAKLLHSAWPYLYRQALDLGMEAGIAIVSVYRNLDTAQLGSPKRLLIAAKVLRGFGYLRDPGYSVLDVSIKLGYKAPRIFSEHWVSVFGVTPARVRTRITDEAAIESVLRWLGAGDDDSLPDDIGRPHGRGGSRPRPRRKPEPS